MSQFLDAFKIKPLDLEPIFESWKDAPVFQGKPKKDMPVDEWLAVMKAGCVERKVPKDYWHKVAYHYLGKNAKARLDEVKHVMRNMHGGKYRWNWKTFKVAMRNMGCKFSFSFSEFKVCLGVGLTAFCFVLGEIDPKKTESFEVQTKPSGWWGIIGKGKSDEKTKDDDKASIKSNVSSSSKSASAPNSNSPRPPPKKSKSTWDVSTFRPFPTPRRAATMSTIEGVNGSSGRVTAEPVSSGRSTPSSVISTATSSTAVSTCSTPGEGTSYIHQTAVPGSHSRHLFSNSTHFAQITVSTTVAQAPTWLVNACTALDFLTGEHPKVMTALSAVLITVGSIPALPVISAGAGGAFLASGTAHAIGSIAVGVGSLLKAIGDTQAAAHGPQAQLQGQARVTEK